MDPITTKKTKKETFEGIFDQMTEQHKIGRGCDPITDRKNRNICLWLSENVRSFTEKDGNNHEYLRGRIIGAFHNWTDSEYCITYDGRLVVEVRTHHIHYVEVLDIDVSDIDRHELKELIGQVNFCKYYWREGGQGRLYTADQLKRLKGLLSQVKKAEMVDRFRPEWFDETTRLFYHVDGQDISIFAYQLADGYSLNPTDSDVHVVYCAHLSDLSKKQLKEFKKIIKFKLDDKDLGLKGVYLKNILLEKPAYVKYGHCTNSPHHGQPSFVGVHVTYFEENPVRGITYVNEPPHLTMSAHCAINAGVIEGLKARHERLDRKYRHFSIKQEKATA